MKDLPNAAARPSRGAVRSAALAAAALALALKLALLLAGAFPFNADEAIVGLMARHILAGERPVFFYGQAYMGSLDAWLVAAGFSAVGEHVWVLRAVQALLYAGMVGTTVLLGARILGSPTAGLIAGLLAAIPTVNVTLYTTVTLGGYGETLLIGSLLLLLSLRIARSPRDRWPFAAWGLLAGIGFWGFALVVAFALPAAVYLSWVVLRNLSRREAWARLALLGACALLGASPWLYAACRDGLSTLILEAGGAAIASASPEGFLQSIGSHVFNLLVFGTTVIFGLRPPWEIRALAWPLMPVALGFGIGTLAYAVTQLRRRTDSRAPKAMLLGVIATLVLGFVLTPFGADPSGRYFLPLVIPLAILGSDLLGEVGRRRRILAGGILGAVLAFQLWGTLQCARRNPPGITTQFDPVSWIDHRADAALMQFLRAHNETRGYSSYWVSYPLAFLSGEELIFVPRLPYHADLRYTERDDRYPAYGALVGQSDRVAYITTHNPRLDVRLREGFAAAGVDFEETVIGDYRVYHGLSRPISPEELDLNP